VKAVTWHGIGDIRFGDVPDPKIEAPTGWLKVALHV